MIELPNNRKGRPAFTLLELMVASVLLAMLVTTLAMIFNQSSIAWRTGIAGVSELGNSREALGTFREICDDLLPGLGDANPSVGAGDNRNLDYRTVSPWDENDNLRTRSFDLVSSVGGGWGKAPSLTIGDAKVGGEKSVTGAENGQNASLFTVGVRSAGPDGAWDTEDDITTFPERKE